MPDGRRPGRVLFCRRRGGTGGVMVDEVVAARHLSQFRERTVSRAKCFEKRR